MSEQREEVEKPKVSPTKIRSLRKRIEEDSETLEKIVDSIISKYNRDLDRFIQKMKSLVERGEDKELSDFELEQATLKIPIFFYFAIGGLESLGIEGDTAKAHKIEVFNNAFMDIEGTIPDKTKHAELEAFSEYLIEVAYSRAYKKLKAQIEAAEHIYSGVKKILSKRMLEIELNTRDPEGLSRRRRYNDD